MTRKTDPLRPASAQKLKLMRECRDMLPGLSREVRRDLARSRKGGKPLHNDRFVDRWIASHLEKPGHRVEVLSLFDMNGWVVEPDSGNIAHESGRIFTITGTHVRHRTPTGEFTWDQPIIDQTGVGILGIIVKNIGGVMHFCLQAKDEPGNINSVQLSPTVQVTYSNYSQLHDCSSPEFLEYFLGGKKGRIIYAKLQTEDGGRFLFKSNRNMVVQIDDNEPDGLPDGFIWLTLKQISRLLCRDNLIHASSRSILSAFVIPDNRDVLPFLAATGGESGSSLSETVQWLDDQKSCNHLVVIRSSLSGLKEWGMDRDGSFSHEEGRFFRVIGLDVHPDKREVTRWNQPILDNPGSGIIGLLTRVHKGKRYFLMQAKVEPGNRTIVQIGPTVQFTPGNYIGNTKLHKPFLFDEFYQRKNFPLMFESMQSKEGSLFFQEAHLHRILELPDGVELDSPADFRWISQGELHLMIHLGETVNSSARSILSLYL